MAKLQLPESQNIECKEIWKDEYLKWVCGFANASGGYIFIGVEDESCEIVGVDNSKRLLEDYNTPRFSDRHNYGGMTRNRYICKKEENQNGKTI